MASGANLLPAHERVSIVRTALRDAALFSVSLATPWDSSLALETDSGTTAETTHLEPFVPCQAGASAGEAALAFIRPHPHTS